jgi:hypothetical protein
MASFEGVQELLEFGGWGVCWSGIVGPTLARRCGRPGELSRQTRRR